MAARRKQGRSARGFTLLEAVLALVIFGIISVTLAMAMSVALQSQTASNQRRDENSVVRAVFGALTRDLTSAYSSMNNPVSVFVSNGQSAGGTTSSNFGLLTLTTLTHRIQADASLGTYSTPTLLTQSLPQSDCALVRYDLDPTTGTLTREESNTPNLQDVSTPPPTMTGNMPSSNVLSSHILSLNMQFWDPTAQTWDNTWDFEQTNQTQSSTTSGTTGTTGTAASTAASSASSTSSTSSTTSGNTTLPSAVQVTLILQRSDGTPVTYMTIIPISVPQPQVAGTGAAKSTTGTGTTGTGTGSTTGTGGMGGGGTTGTGGGGTNAPTGTGG